MVHEDAETKQIVAAKGKVVMYVRYHGYAELDNIIENIAREIVTLTEKKI